MKKNIQPYPAGYTLVMEAVVIDGISYEAARTHINTLRVYGRKEMDELLNIFNNKRVVPFCKDDVSKLVSILSLSVHIMVDYPYTDFELFVMEPWSLSC